MTNEDTIIELTKGRKILKKTKFGDLIYIHLKCDEYKCNHKQVYGIYKGEIVSYFHLKNN